MRHAITNRAKGTLSKYIFSDTMSDTTSDTIDFILHLPTPRHHFVKKPARFGGIIGIIVSAIEAGGVSR